MTDPDDLDSLRAALSGVDGDLLRLVARRTELSLAIGRAKRDLGLGTRDFTREKVVLELARGRAADLGLPPALAERLMLTLIEASLSVQELDRVARTGSTGRALILGGSGKMGGWFASFLGAQGWQVEIADPTRPALDLPWRADWQDGPLDHDLLIVALPLSATNAALHALAQARPTGVVCDLGSLKTPLRSGLLALRDAGVSVTSLHPMFGPDTNLLSGKHVLFVDVGVPAATERVRALFAATLAQQSDCDLDTHDRLMAFVLGLSHALNLAFNQALAASGAALPSLQKISSATFDAQLGVSSRVAGENPHLYYEIQALNEHGQTSLQALSDAVEHLRRLVTTGDEQGFVTMMQAGAAYLDARRAASSGGGQT